MYNYISGSERASLEQVKLFWLTNLVDFDIIILSTANRSKTMDKVHEERYDNGQLRLRFHDNDGKIDGLYEMWHKNGQPSMRANYKNGKLHGLSEWWNENGQLVFREKFKNGFEVSIR